MTVTQVVTGIGTWLTEITGWFGDVFEYLTSSDVLPFTLIGVSLMIVGLAFQYVRSILRGIGLRDLCQRHNASGYASDH
jgi:hypothetical protein